MLNGGNEENYHFKVINISISFEYYPIPEEVFRVFSVKETGVQRALYQKFKLLQVMPACPRCHNS